MIQRRPLTYDDALNRVASLCSKCEQCSPDLIKKMKGWGVSDSDIRRIISRLEEMRFLDDERFARAYAHDKLRFSGWGRMKIARGLWAKRLPRDIIDMAIAEIDEEEYNDVAMRVMSSRCRLNPGLLDSYEDRVKLLRHGVSRGFEISLISKIIKTLQYQRDDR